MRGAPINTRQPKNKSSTGSASLKGTDRLLHIDDVSTLNSQTVVINQIIDGYVTDRLANMAKSYNRMEWLKLKFTVVPQVPTTVGGGYVTAFVQDASIKVPNGNEGLTMITSTDGAQTKKFWETTNVKAKVPCDELYSKFVPTEPRWSSPGVFVFAVDGKATDHGSITIYMEWSVRFTSPIVAVEEEKGETILISTEPLVTQGGHTGIWTWEGDKFISDPSSGHFLADCRAAFPDFSFTSENSQGAVSINLFPLLPTYFPSYNNDGTAFDSVYRCNRLSVNISSGATYAGVDGVNTPLTTGDAVGYLGKAFGDVVIYPRGSQFIFYKGNPKESTAPIFQQLRQGSQYLCRRKP